MPKRLKRALLLCGVGAASATVAAVAAAPGSGTEQSGHGYVNGAVFVTGICTGIPADDRHSRTCDVDARVLRARVTVRSLDNRFSKTVRTGGDGRFSVRVAPGDYVVTGLHPRRRSLPRPPKARTVSVPGGGYTDVILDYDSGLR
jgi:hypothetical protein